MDRRRFLAIGVAALGGCTQFTGDSNDIQDSDGDGVIDSEDYAPQDPDVQEKSDLQSTATATATASPTPTATATPSPTPTPSPTEAYQFEENREENTPVPDSDDDGVADPLDDFPDNPDYSTRYASEEGTKYLTTGEYFYWQWSQDDLIDLQWSIEVTEGSAIDVIVMDEHEFSNFEDGDSYEYYTAGTDLETKAASKTITLGAGDYRFILSNVDAGIDEAAQVDFEYLQAA